MATFVLVPGAWHDSWCWSEIASLLEGVGHRVLTPDLLMPEGGAQRSSNKPVADWADRVAALVKTQPEAVILVGHSRGGIVISEVAERVPERVRLLVYLAAFLLRDGESLQDVAQRADNAASFASAVALESGMLRFSSNDVERLFYNQTRSDLVRVARERLAPEPALAFVTPVHVTNERFGSVPRAYIECTEDQAIPLATQREMQAALPCAATVRLKSDHSPFFSMPAELVEALDGCLRDVAI